MKTSRLYFFLLFCPLTVIWAEDLTTLDGKVYKSIRVSSETPTHVKIMHDDGISQLEKAKLPPRFLILHELSAPPHTVVDPAEAEAKKWLSAFVANTPKFMTKDGREFNSADIFAVEPSGLRIRNDAGILKLQFQDLPEKVRLAFHFDALKASAFEADEKSKLQARQSEQKKQANAASVVDTFRSTMRLRLMQNVGLGWLCEADVIEKVDAFSTQERFLDHYTRIMVFGLPKNGLLPAHVQQNKLWSGEVYRVGTYDFVGAATGFESKIYAVHTDRDTALKWQLKNGTAAVYNSNGDTEAVTADTSKSVGTYTGTGFAITDNGFIGTAAHVVRGAQSIQIHHKETIWKATIKAINDDRDIAILEVANVSTLPLKLQSTSKEKLGGELFCVGFPLVDRLGINAKLTKGQLNAQSGLLDDEGMFQMSTQIQPGNSGGPVCNSAGEVIGIVSKTGSTIAGASGGAGAVPQNVNFATKADAMIELSKTISEIQLPSSVTSTAQTPEERVLESTYLITVVK